MGLHQSLSWLKVPYDDSNHFEGYWGAKTSTLNFCEEDYVLSYYCAEVCNTLTNLAFLWLGLKGIRNCLTQSHAGIFLLSYIGYIVVGVGSTAFHASLKYPMQLVDELSMIYTTCLMCFATFSFSKTKLYSSSLAASLFALAGFITVYYHTTKDPTFHQNCYAALTALVVFRSMYVMEMELRPALLKRNKVKAKRVLNDMWIMVATGLAVFLMGYVIWILDTMYCTQIRQWRRQLELPWAIVLEGHAWWHLMTGLGAYFYITWGIWLRHCLEGREDEYVLLWPGLLTSVPEIVRVRKIE